MLRCIASGRLPHMIESFIISMENGKANMNHIPPSLLIGRLETALQDVRVKNWIIIDMKEDWR